MNIICNLGRRMLCCALLGLVISIPALGGPAPAPPGLSDVKPPDRLRGDTETEGLVRSGMVRVKFKSAVTAAKLQGAAFANATRRHQIQDMQPQFPGLTPAAARTPAAAARLAALRHVYVVRYDGPAHPRLVAAELARDPSVEYAEPIFVHHPTGFATAPPRRERGALVALPNDPRYGDMTHLTQIQVAEAWDVVKGETGTVVVAIVDGGTDWRHDDLVANVWTNPDETDGNGVDDDENGLVDDVNGWNFANSEPDPTGLTATPDNASHGTWVAGIVAGVTNNATGIAGVGWNVRFIPVNVSCEDTDRSLCYGYEGILYAAIEGADVINVSWGGASPSLFGREVIDLAYENGSLVVTSSGNGPGNGQGVNNDRNPAYPANYDNVLVVGATNKEDDIKADFSNYGLTVDVFAPGIGNNTTAPDGLYTDQISGTSFSSPMAAGVAALVKTQHPEWSVDQVREQVRVTADNIDADNLSFFQGLLGKGRVNALRAITESSPALRVSQVAYTDSGLDGTANSGETLDLSVEFVNYLADASDVTVSITPVDRRITVENNTAVLGAVASSQSAMADFTVTLGDPLPDDFLAEFVVDYSAGDYVDREPFRLLVNRITHDTGPIRVTLTREGNIGWTGFQGESGSRGQGFVYLGIDWLFEGGLMIGAGGDVSDAIRGADGETQHEDFSQYPASFFGIYPAEATTEGGLVKLIDGPAASPHGFRIHQESYADVNEGFNEFIIVRYLISIPDAVAAKALDDVYVGLFFDWDLFIGDIDDYALYDAGRQMGYVQDDLADPLIFLGTRLLTAHAPAVYRAIDNATDIYGGDAGDGFTDEEKWAFLSGGVEVESVDATDVSTLMGSGPYALVPGGEIEVAFAIVGGTTIEELNTSADNAQLVWDNTLSGLAPNPVATEPGAAPTTVFALEAAYPNPAHDAAAIRFSLPRQGAVTLTVYDLLGRAVRTLVQGDRPAGTHTVTWDGTADGGQQVASGMYLYRLTAQQPDGLRTQTRKMILLH